MAVLIGGLSFRDYPRVCGGTSRRSVKIRISSGLSPRVRGNRAARQLSSGADGTIPACAGEPAGKHGRDIERGDYPRVCGGTAVDLLEVSLVTGLSPRVRGNRPEAVPSGGLPRTIPACAGEPPAPPPPCWARRDYPRVCGGTTSRSSSSSLAGGLSPRVRGNHAMRMDSTPVPRTIPACAGEPA
mgnify:CR=1 FL=1